MTSLNYTKTGDYRIPNLTLQNQQTKELGRYGRMRRNYLKEHRPILYNRLILSEKLHQHLAEIDQTANRRMEQLMDELMKSNGLTEALKAADPMKWTGLMNNLKSQAEETIMTELIYS